MIDNPTVLFPDMPHDVHRALWKILEYAGSLERAEKLLAEFATKQKEIKL